MMASCAEDNILQVWQVAFEQYDRSGANELDDVGHME